MSRRSPDSFTTERKFSNLSASDALSQAACDAIMGRIAVHPDSTIVEIGCGQGGALQEIGGQWPATTRIGVDPASLGGKP